MARRYWPEGGRRPRPVPQAPQVPGVAVRDAKILFDFSFRRSLSGGDFTGGSLLGHRLRVRFEFHIERWRYITGRDVVSP